MPSPVDTLLAIEAIKQLKARYFRFMDVHDWDEFRTLFTEDALFDVRGALEETPDLSGQEPIVGADAPRCSANRDASTRLPPNPMWVARLIAMMSSSGRGTAVIGRDGLVCEGRAGRARRRRRQGRPGRPPLRSCRAHRLPRLPPRSASLFQNQTAEISSANLPNLPTRSGAQITS